jgi:hypothetical protein
MENKPKKLVPGWEFLVYSIMEYTVLNIMSQTVHLVA